MFETTQLEKLTKIQRDTIWKRTINNLIASSEKTEQSESEPIAAKESCTDQMMRV